MNFFKNKNYDKLNNKHVLVGERVIIECAVCLQNCIYPVQLPCKHIFCFLCVKVGSSLFIQINLLGI